MVRQTLYFLYENGFAILFVALIFTMLMVYIVLNDIKFKTQKVKLEKVLVVEKMANPPPSLKQLNTEVENQSNNNSTCKNLNDKTSCTALGSCVWVLQKIQRTIKNVLQLKHWALGQLLQLEVMGLLICVFAQKMVNYYRKNTII